jgi:hypothetical protein
VLLYGQSQHTSRVDTIRNRKVAAIWQSVSVCRGRIASRHGWSVPELVARLDKDAEHSQPTMLIKKLGEELLSRD